MSVVLVLLVVVVAGLAVAVVAGRLGGHVDGLDAPTSTASFDRLPDGRLTADDLAAVGFDRALRGYRMDQVDQVLDRLVAELAQRDADLARRQDAGTWVDTGDTGPVSATEDLAPATLAPAEERPAGVPAES